MMALSHNGVFDLVRETPLMYGFDLLLSLNIPKQ